MDDSRLVIAGTCMKIALPKRWINRTLVLLGLFGVVFQLTAAIYALLHGITLQAGWLLTLAAPLLCVASGAIPALQLQKEAQ